MKRPDLRAVRGIPLGLAASLAVWLACGLLPDLPSTLRFLAALAAFAVFARASTGGNDGDAEGLALSALKRDFAEMLRSTIQGHRWSPRQWRRRYDRPWYLVVGPPHSGKTALVRGLGLHPVSPAHASGRLICGWWVGAAAVVGDADMAPMLWRALLRLLRRVRPLLPLNGLLVTVPADVLAFAPHEDRVAWAGDIRARLAEAERCLRMRVPTYLLVTGMDRVPGFVESFLRMDRDILAQPWGTLFAADEGAQADPGAMAASALGQIIRRFEDRVTLLAHSSPTPTAAPAILRFLPALEALREPLTAFVADAFGRTSTNRQPLLRGLFLTSAGEFTESDRGKAPARTCFLGELVAHVSCCDGGCANAFNGLERRRLWRDATLWCASVAASLAIGLLAIQYDHAERSALATVLRRATDNSAYLAKHFPRPPLPAGDAAEASDTWDRLGSLFDDLDAPNWQATLFGRPIEGEVREGLARASLHLTDSLLTPIVAALLEARLRAHFAEPEYERKALAIYNMVTGVQAMDAALLGRWVEREVAGPEGRRSQFQHQLARLLASDPQPYRRDHVLVGSVQRRLEAEQRCLPPAAGRIR